MSTRYDHGIRNAIVKNRDIYLFKELNIPSSTIRDWIRKGPAKIITVPELDMDASELILQIERLKRKLEKLEAKANLFT